MTARTDPTATMIVTTIRHRVEGRRPSGNDMMVTPTRTKTRGSGHTPIQVTHSTAGNAPPPSLACSPYWRPKNITAWATPVARNSHPSRLPGRRLNTKTPTPVNAGGDEPVVQVLGVHAETEACADQRRGQHS